MFGLGMTEILMILAIALIVVGPKKLPELAKTLGRAMGEFKRSAQDFKRSIDIESTVKDIGVPKTDIKDILNETDKKTDNDPGNSDTSDTIDVTRPFSYPNEKPDENKKEADKTESEPEKPGSAEPSRTKTDPDTDTDTTP